MTAYGFRLTAYDPQLAADSPDEACLQAVDAGLAQGGDYLLAHALHRLFRVAHLEEKLCRVSDFHPPHQPRDLIREIGTGLFIEFQRLLVRTLEESMGSMVSGMLKSMLGARK